MNFFLELYQLYLSCDTYHLLNVQTCLNARLLSRMPICRKKCSKMLSMSPPRPSKNTTSKRISLPTSRRNSTKNTTQHGTVLSVATSAATSHTRPSTLSTFTLDKLPSFCSSLVKRSYWTVILLTTLLTSTTRKLSS